MLEYSYLKMFVTPELDDFLDVLAPELCDDEELETESRNANSLLEDLLRGLSWIDEGNKEALEALGPPPVLFSTICYELADYLQEEYLNCTQFELRYFNGLKAAFDTAELPENWKNIKAYLFLRRTLDGLL